MTHTDPIADMLTRIRNATMVEKATVEMPLSKVKLEIAKLLKREGFVHNFKVENSVFPAQLILELKYSGKKSVIEGLKRISKPGCRVYASSDEIPNVLGGLGVALLSTSKGIMTGRECEKNRIGGEVLLHIW
ncbi:MAG: 30S ribosomal protein S8 [Candidatus Aminicenantes bacterium]|nr:30S ribosomal protein S8 [Candidatus Aminicenantes bacterium]